MKNTTDLFNALIKNDEVAAFDAFKETIDAKLQTALDVKKVGLTADIFSESIEEPLEESGDSIALVKCHTPQAAKRLEQKLKNKWSGFRDGSYHLKVVGDTLEVQGQSRFTRFIKNEPEVVSIKG